MKIEIKISRNALKDKEYKRHTKKTFGTPHDKPSKEALIELIKAMKNH